MSAANIQDIYPLSPMQEGMLFHSLYAPEEGLYLEQAGYALRGPLDVAAFERAWARVVARHAILRTAFVWEGIDEPLQVVHAAVELPIARLDWRAVAPAERPACLEQLAAEERARGLDLAAAPLMRLALVRLGPDEWHLLWTHHHLLLDGWSVPLLLHELFTLYRAYARGEEVNLPEPAPYRDYIALTRGYDRAAAEAFWRRELAGFAAPTPLPGRAPTTSPTTSEPGVLTRALDQTTTSALQALARRHGLTLSTVAQGAWALLLSRSSGEEDIVFGATVAGRPPELPGAATMVGLFINTLPVRVQAPPDEAADAWLRRLQARLAELRQYEQTPLVQIQGWSAVPRGAPLFESLLVFENYPVDAALRESQGELHIAAAEGYSRTNYPLTVEFAPGAGLSVTISYDRARFAEATVARMLGHLCALLEGLAADATRPLGALPMLTAAEREQIRAWSATTAPFPADRCLHQLVAERAARAPEAVAARCDGVTLTYGELDARATRLAGLLRRRGVGAETIVGICLPRTPDLIVAFLAVLKAGGAYLPLDPDYPPGRLAFMLEDTAAPLVLTTTALAPRLGVSERRLLLLDQLGGALGGATDTPPETAAGPANLAYVIYTSGSTGQPKGVLIEHRGLVNFAHNEIANLDLGPTSRVLLFAALGFDASVAELALALSAGAALVLAPRETLADGQALVRLLRDEGVTMAILPPALLAALPDAELPELRTLITAGEGCPPAVARRWMAGRRLFNGYGPTEATIGVSHHPVAAVDDGLAALPISRPMPNTALYILDRAGQPAPVGVPGELHIGGVGVARGYLNRPELTAERFVPDPFVSEPGARMYRTGDLGRWRPDGTIEFLGRADQQVKLRGYRIELGEVEAAVRAAPGVRDAAVIVREDTPGERRLVAYVVPAGGDGAAGAPAATLREALRERLPEQMVPAAFVALDALPLTPSGKVDRKALPAPDGDALAAAAYVAPRTPVEEILAGIWAEVLGVARVGAHDDFFALGGHSLLAVRALSRVREALAVELPLRALFEEPTVARLAEAVGAARRAGAAPAPPLTPTPRDGELPLSFSQQRLWFLDQLEPGSPLYNNPAALRLRGRLDPAALAAALGDVVARHEALRTTFAADGGRPYQRVAPALRPPLELRDLRELEPAAREAALRRLAADEAATPFDLAAGPLLRATLLRAADDDHVLLLTIHHIVSDAWSVGVLVRELVALYGERAGGPPASLPPLPVQYADYAAWQRAWLQGATLEAQLRYWTERLRGAPALLTLPTDRPRPSVQSYRGATLPFSLPADLSAELAALSQREGATLFMTLLAAFQALLHRYSGQETICVGTPVAGRSRRELEGLIGFFVNTLVLRADLDAGTPFRDLLEQAREAALGAYAHQDLPFEMLVEALQPERNLSHSPVFQVMLVLDNTGAPGDDVSLPGLAVEPLEADSATARFDMTLVLGATPEGLRGALEYNSDLFDEATAARMLDHYATLLASIAADPEQPVGALELLPPDEARRVLVEWNATAAPFADGMCAHQLFEAWAERRPDAPALACEGLTWSYGELNRWANQLAHYLRGRDVGPGRLVGIAVGRAPELVVAALAVLKAGGAYVPLDPAYPPERLAFMLADSRAPLVLTTAAVAPRLPAGEAGGQAPELLLLDQLDAALAAEPAANPEPAAGPDDLAYVIYTSGSTGRPKGAMLHHRGLCNLVAAQERAFGVGPGKRVLQFSPFSFDASVWELVMALCTGATIVLAPQETLAAGPELLRLLRDEAITTVTLPPSLLAILDPAALPELGTVVAAGERCSREIVARWAPGRRFFNAYGPTETTVCASMALCDPADPADPPIGRPIGNARLYILDSAGRPTPIGVPGELHIGGVGVARGYLNRPELTAEKFLPDPFSAEPGARLYRTGDLARYRPDGNVEFLGRIDHQIKLRGFRIELGEVEAALRAHPAVQDAVVLAREDTPGLPRLVGYYLAGEAAPTAGELQAFLRERLPEYMVPAAYVRLAAWPLSPSGKVERSALPAPEAGDHAGERAYVAPVTPEEAALAEICAELLGVARVGVHDDFFALGGHSLLATQLIWRVQERLGVEVPLRALFEHPTVAGLAAYVAAHRDDTGAPAAPAIARRSRDERRVRRSAVGAPDEAE